MGVAPTGSRVVDMALSALGVGLVTASGYLVPSRLVLVCGVITTLVEPRSVLGLAAMVLVLAAELVRRREPIVGVVSCGLVALASMRLGAGPFHGSTAIVGVVVCVALLIGAIANMERVAQRRTIAGSAVVCGLAISAITSFVWSGAAARRDVANGQRELLAGLDAFGRGEQTESQLQFLQAEESFAVARRRLSNPVGRATRFIPLVAQHREFALDLTRSGEELAAAASHAAARNGLNDIRLSNGTVDLRNFDRLESSLDRLDAAISQLRTQFDAPSPWLLPQLTTRLTRYQAQVADASESVDSARLAARALPLIFGETSQRRYLVAVGTTSESRGLGPFIGNWFELNINGGRISQGAAYRTGDLITRTLAAPPLRLDASADYLARYARFGAVWKDQNMSPLFWSNVTMSPDLVSTGKVIRQMYLAATGNDIDGVIVLTPASLRALLVITGPVTVEGWPTPIDATNAEQFLLFDQYRLDSPNRIDLLYETARATFEALVVRPAIPFRELATALTPSVSSGDLLVWSRHLAEHELLDTIDITGALPAVNGNDALLVVTNNASPNKIDSFLKRDVTYEVTYDVLTGATRGLLGVELVNSAPTSGLPDYIIGNGFGLPTGSNRTYLSIYSPLDLGAVMIDGALSAAMVEREGDYYVYSLFLDLAPGATRFVVLELNGVLDTGGYRITARPTSSVERTELAITTNDTPLTSGNWNRNITINHVV